MVRVTSHKSLVAMRGLFVCLLAYYSKTCEWISMKFLGKIEDGTSNEPLNFISDPWPWQRFALSKCTLRAKVCALRVLVVDIGLSFCHHICLEICLGCLFLKR